MMDYAITLEADENDWRAGQIWLIAHSPHADRAQRYLIYSGKNFAVDDIREAIFATPWIRQLEDGSMLLCDVRPSHLAEVVQEMLCYFDAPEAPRRALMDVKAAVAEHDALVQSNVTFDEIPWYAYAWLDVMVREDIADAARGANNVWRKHEVAIDCHTHCHRRVAELIARLTPPMRMVGRMAGSLPSRPASDSREAKTG